MVPEQRQAEWTIRKAIEELVSLNKNQGFIFPRGSCCWQSPLNALVCLQ